MLLLSMGKRGSVPLALRNLDIFRPQNCRYLQHIGKIDRPPEVVIFPII